MRLNNNIVLGTVNRKIAPRLRVVYDQMPKPKYVAAMGSCAITGGLYFDSYNVLPGVDNILLADVYVPGCPPRPETHPGNNALARDDKAKHLEESVEISFLYGTCTGI